MYIINQNKTTIYNVDKIEKFEVFKEFIYIKMENDDTEHVIGKYDSEEQARNEMEKILRNMTLLELADKKRTYELSKNAPENIAKNILDEYHNILCYKMP